MRAFVRVQLQGAGQTFQHMLKREYRSCSSQRYTTQGSPGNSAAARRKPGVRLRAPLR